MFVFFAFFGDRVKLFLSSGGGLDCVVAETGYACCGGSGSAAAGLGEEVKEA